MISRFRTSIQIGGGDGRVVARVALAVVAAVLCFVLVLGGASTGMAGLSAQPSPSGSPSGGGGSDEPSVAFVNPSILYDGHLPVIADRDDRVDSDYHIVAWTGGKFVNPIVEASILPLIEGIPIGNEQTIGTLDPVEGTTDTWEHYWDIPATVPDGDAIMTVRLFTETALGTD